ncbi:transporter substrate-binding domain-containing protein [Caproicibacter fermentans]|nr:transporter substrate-binding domain-containing protein [Caproicibacter fermentans]QNK40815.1 transporter substrate-binding domain-containing protein [Caproicibacter fermentans]
MKRIGRMIAAALSVCMLLSACSPSSGMQDGQSAVNTSGSQASAPKSGDTSLQRVLDAGKLTVVGSGGYPPFNYIDDSGNVIGFDVDVGQEIAKRMGVKLNYVTSEWSGLIEGLRNSRYDAILGSMAITEERLQSVNFTTPYYYSGAQLVVRSDSGFTDPNQLKGKKIAVATGTNFEQDVNALGAESALYDDDNSTMLELISGRVDGVITDRLVALEAKRKMKEGDRFQLLGKVMRVEKMGIAVNQNDTSLLNKLNEIVQAMHDDGTLTQISKKWQGGADITVQ